MDNLLRIGVITTPHGLKGEVKVFPTTDDAKRFDSCDEVIVMAGKEQLKLHVQYAKYFKNMVILKFKEYSDINEIERFRKCDIMVTRDNAVPLEEGEFFICDAIGSVVREENGNQIGVLKDVMETGANFVFVIETSEGKEVLFPSIPECIKKVDTENKEIIAYVMPGLMDE